MMKDEWGWDREELSMCNEECAMGDGEELNL